MHHNIGSTPYSMHCAHRLSRRTPLVGRLLVVFQRKGSVSTLEMGQVREGEFVQRQHIQSAIGRSKDHSDADKRFASQVGIKFYTPEDFFSSDDSCF